MDDKLKEKLLELPKEDLVEYIDNLFEIEQYEYEKLIKIKEIISNEDSSYNEENLMYIEKLLEEIE